MKKKKLFEWVIIILIILFFAIPLCTLAINESVAHWPTCSTHFVYHLLLKWPPTDHVSFVFCINLSSPTVRVDGWQKRFHVPARPPGT